jgi:hypothetical protein
MQLLPILPRFLFIEKKGAIGNLPVKHLIEVVNLKVCPWVAFLVQSKSRITISKSL